jgi:GNAT superfamily N-acetyltransferase
MKTQSLKDAMLEILPATADRWDDLETLFGKYGASAGCWCMFWRLPFKEFKQIEGEGARVALKELTARKCAPGLLAYIDGEPIGWCSLAPRGDYLGLERSRRFKRVDDQPVWSIVCFFIKRAYRNKGVMAELLRGAVNYAAEHGAKVVEGYPVDLRAHLLAGKKLTGDSGYMGIASVFRAVGFKKVADVSETQLVMRYSIQ